MSNCTDTFMKAEAGSGALIDAFVADNLVTASVLLNDIAGYELSLIAGPLRADRQHWTAIAQDGESANVAPGCPLAARFIVPSAVEGRRAAIKPWDIGLYTSTAPSEGRSMWREYLELFLGSTLYPLPWHTWEMEIDVSNIRIAEIVSATKWVSFVDTYARTSDGLVYPDWVKVAQDFDAVHVTLPAIVAAQGFYFRTQRGIIPPAFWDVDATFWLRWRFSGARLIETVDAR
jgi:hypothetical protein